MIKQACPQYFSTPELEKLQSGLGVGKKAGFIAIDPSVTACGIAYDFSCQAPRYETIETSEKTDGHLLQRYNKILRRLRSLVRKGGPKNLFFIMENYSYGSRGAGLVQLHGIGEMIRMLAWKKTGFPPLMVAPGQIKKFLSGKGNLSKEDVKLKAYKLFNIEFATTHEAEAYTLGVIGMAVVRGMWWVPAPTEAQRNVVNTIISAANSSVIGVFGASS